MTEVNVLAAVDHPNLVKLIGYCAEDDERGMQRLLVYEYLQNRSVEHHLSTQSKTTLSWYMRLRIAIDSARGLAYLHEGMDFQVYLGSYNSLVCSYNIISSHFCLVFPVCNFIS